MTSTNATPTPMQKPETQQDQPSAAELARVIARSARKAFLGTLDKSSGHPHVSLVTVATEPDGTPVLLLSRLAVHTQNLLADPRCSLLFDATDLNGDPLEGGRVTLIGSAQATTDQTARRRFLARHPAAEGYASFADFAFYRLAVERAHYIGGFGRIATMPASDILIDVSAAADLIAGEPGIVEHMNDDHSDAVRLYATVLAGRADGDWRMTGIDPSGMDLVNQNGVTTRIAFEKLISSPMEARHELVRLVGVAREKGGTA